MRAIVTGGAGFIGSNLVDALLDQGVEVSVIDTLVNGRRANLAPALQRGAELHEVDVCDGSAIRALLKDARPRWIFHLAAQIDVRRSVSDPLLDAEVNVAGTINVLEAALAAGAERFVYSSTGGALYGEAAQIPTAESAQIQPQSGYGQSKYAGEGYCDVFRRLHGLATVTLRYANVYGPRQDPLGEGGVVAIYCGALRSGATPTVFGDGLQTRDYVHVDDVVAANLAAANTDSEGAFNIGGGAETSVLDLVERFSRLAGEAGFRPEFQPQRPGEVRRSCLDCSRARKTLEWRPRVALDEGLRLTLASLP